MVCALKSKQETPLFESLTWEMAKNSDRALFQFNSFADSASLYLVGVVPAHFENTSLKYLASE